MRPGGSQGLDLTSDRRKVGVAFTSILAILKILGLSHRHETYVVVVRAKFDH